MAGVNVKPLNVFIGFDSRETIAYHVLSHSIMRHASGPVSITPLVQQQLRDKGLYTREKGKFESTEFSLTRFLVPYLSGYGGFSLFLDCDMLCQGDVYEILKIAKEDEHRALWCVQHDYQPKTKLKFLHQVQTSYPRKNWSSVMLFRNKFCEDLTLERVNTATGLELHRMLWAGKDENIGKLPPEWNWLSGEYVPNHDAKLIHFTLGGPWFADHCAADHADLWWAEYEAMMNPVIRVKT